jgi:hypothetical protein
MMIQHNHMPVTIIHTFSISDPSRYILQFYAFKLLRNVILIFLDVIPALHEQLHLVAAD